MGDLIRFGRAITDFPEELEFGDWGVMDTADALDVFQETLEWFDREDVRKAEKARAEMIRAARKYYDGHHVKPLKVNPGEPDDNILVNLCRVLVDDSVSWLFGDPETGVLGIDVVRPQAQDDAGGDQVDETDDTDEAGDGEESSEQDPENDPVRDQIGQMLEQVYERSGGYHFFKRWGLRGAVAGHYFLKIVPQEDDLPKVVVLDPTRCGVRTDDSDDTHVIAYKVEWKREERSPTGRKDTYIYRQLAVEAAPDTWVVGDFKCKERQRREWTATGGPWAWPWKWAPILDGVNLEPGWGYYGLSDLEDLPGINDGLNFLISNGMRIVKHHAHPKTIGTGFAAGEVQESAIDSFWTIENPEARVQNLEMTSDQGLLLALLDFLRVAFWTIGRGLDPSTFKDKIGQITNFALRVLAIRALKKLGDKRQSYGKTLRTLNSRLAEMAEWQDIETLIQWPEPLPEAPDDTLRQLETEVSMGITSLQTAAEELGRSWAVERARIARERQARQTIGQQILEEWQRGRGDSPFGEQPAGEQPAENEAVT